MRRLVSLSMLILLTLPFVKAQNGRHCRHALYGVVTDSETLEPLSFATVYIPQLEKGVATGEDGQYRITGLCDGPLKITVEHVGCETTDYEVSIQENTHFDISLPHSHSHHMDDVLIVDEHPGPKNTNATSSLDGEALEKTRGKSLGEALKDINGVNALQTGPSIFKPIIQGLHSNRVLVLNNGVRQEGQQWGSEHGPEIDPFVANKLTVVKGASGVRYGPDAIAGVVLVEPADLPDSVGIGGAANLVGMSNGWQGAASAMVEGKFERLKALSWRVQGTLKRGGNVSTPTYILGNTGLREYNFSWAANWTQDNYGLQVYYSQFNSDIGIFTGAHIGNLTDLMSAIERGNPNQTWDFTYDIARPAQHIEHELTKANGYWKTGELGEIKATYSRQYNLRQEYDKHTPRNDSLAALNEPELHYEVTTHQGELLWAHEKFGRFNGQIGVTGQAQKNTYDGFYLIPNYLARNFGVFALERLVRLRWELEAGIRYDYKWLRTWRRVNGEIVSPVQEWANFSGTLGALYRVSPHFEISANVGTAWRPPQVNELFADGVHHGTASFEQGDPNLQQEQALNSILTLTYKGHQKVQAEVNVFANYIRDFIYSQPVLPPKLTIRGSFPTFEYRQADVRILGGDARGTYSPLHGLSLEARGSFLRARNLTIDDYLVLMPGDQIGGKVRYQLDDGELLRRPYVSVDYTYNRQQHRVPVDQDYTDPPEGYGLVTLDAGFSLDQQKRQSLDFGVSVYNALNVSYRNYLNRFRYYADEMGRNFVLRLKYNF